MKKWFIGLSLLLVLFLAGIYVFIPRQLTLSAITYVHCPPAAAFRVVSQENSWPKWNAPSDDTYRLTKKMYNSLDVTIVHEGVSIDSRFLLLPLSSDSVVFQWKCSLPESDNPFTRLSRYVQAIRIKKNMKLSLDRLPSFLSRTENVYGSPIRQIAEMDTSLISTRIMLPAYPNTAVLYRLVDTLKHYILAQGGRVVGHPIMNVSPMGNQFQLMVAVPTDRTLPEKGDFVRRRMIPRAFIIADVKGGDSTVRDAFHQVSLYFEDYKRVAMAIPFAALITDRVQEPDTSRWMTRIYVPVY